MNSFNFSTIPIFYRHFSKWGEFNSKTTTNGFLSAMSLRRTSNDRNSCPSLLRQNLDKQDSSNVKKILPKNTSKKSFQRYPPKKILTKKSFQKISPKRFLQKYSAQIFFSKKSSRKIVKRFQKKFKQSKKFPDNFSNIWLMQNLANATFSQNQKLH